MSLLAVRAHVCCPASHLTLAPPPSFLFLFACLLCLLCRPSLLTPTRAHRQMYGSGQLGDEEPAYMNLMEEDDFLDHEGGYLDVEA